MDPGEGNAPSSGLRFRDLTGFSTQRDGKPTGHVSSNKTADRLASGEVLPMQRNHRASPPGVGGLL